MVFQRQIAYFSMEIAVDQRMPTYSGGLGILAGDSLRSAADMRLPMVAVSLLHRKGYFLQRLDAQGQQHEEPADWNLHDHVTLESPRVTVQLQGRYVQVAIWKYVVRGYDGWSIPVYFLDTDVPENEPLDRTITHLLYGGDSRYRLLQEAVLGMGGVKALRALGYTDIHSYHMNEGHASLLTLELVAEQSTLRRARGDDPIVEDSVRSMCVFTTHTPVAAGHDVFPLDMVSSVLGHQPVLDREDSYCANGLLNLTTLAMHFSGYANGVSRRHGEVSRKMFHTDRVDAITNGVHPTTWVGPELAAVFDQRIPEWRGEPGQLRLALNLPDEELWNAHQQARTRMVNWVNEHSGSALNTDHFTLCFARRNTGYKRADLLLSDLDRLKRMAKEIGPFQIVYGGKAHPRDGQGKELIKRIHAARDALAGDIVLAYVPNYDFAACRLMAAGSDLWVNNPMPPLEASGTSGMKAAMNGVPSLSTLDGWWLEGCTEGLTGWAIGGDRFAQSMDAEVVDDRAGDAASLYDKLENFILPMYLKNRAGWLNVMKHAIALNGPYFSSHRMMRQYADRAYAK